MTRNQQASINELLPFLFFFSSLLSPATLKKGSHYIALAGLELTM